MRSNIDTRNLSEQIKVGLQICYKALNKDKHPEREYRLFNGLAELYLQKEKVREYPKAGAIYQYTKKLIEVHLNGNQEKLESIEQRIKVIEARFLGKVLKPDIKSREQRVAGIESYKEELVKFREVIKKELAVIEDLGIEKDKEELNEEGLQRRAQEVERIYMRIREFFIGKRDEGGEIIQSGLVNWLTDDCIRELGGLPKVRVGEKSEREVEYAVFGMGSMALGTMTPWSDLEFGILIEEGLTKEEENRVKEYFKNLTSLLHIKVVNFGETPLRMMGIKELNNFKLTEKSDTEYNWFFDDLISSGFSFDGPHWHACKTPLGRAKGYQKITKAEDGTEVVSLCEPHELIGTVSEFNNFYKDKNWSKEDAQLVQVLEHITFITGSIKLVLQYKEKQIRQTELIRSLAFKILKEDSRQLDPSKQIFNSEKEGQILSVKKEIYRFPDRMIIALADCLGIKGDSNWELIRNMQGINVETRKGLEAALSTAVELRLRTYANNGGQKEDISTLSKYELEVDQLRKNEIMEKIFHFKDVNILCSYYKIILELSFKLKQIKYISELESISKLQLKEEFNLIIKGYIFKRFLKYYEAIEEFERIEQRVAKLENYVVLYNEIKSALAKLYQIVGQYEKALDYERDSLSIERRIYKNDHVDIAASLNNIGGSLEALGKYEEALKYLQQGLEMMRRIYKNDHADMADSLNNIGTTLGNLSRNEEALKYLQEGLEMRRRIYKNSHIDIASSLNNIGVILNSLGWYEEALGYFLDSLEIRRGIYKGIHTSVAQSLNNIGITLQSTGSYERALKYHQEGLEMRRKIYKGDHASIAQSLNNIGNTLESLGRYEKALEYFHNSLEMRKRCYVGDHADIAASLNSIGNTFESLGKFGDALKYFYDSLDMRNKIYKGDHRDLANSFNNVGNILAKLGKHEEALKCHQKCLEMRRRIYKNDHSDIAESLNNIGNILESIGEYEEALLYHHESLRIERRIYGGDHINIATSLNNIGNTLDGLNRHEESLEYHRESIEMRKRFYDGDHAHIARSLSNMGATLQKLERYEEALICKQESLEMMRRIYKGDHTDIAALLNNIGTNLQRLDRFEEALRSKQESLEMMQRIYQGDHVDIAMSLNNIGSTLQSLDRYEEAVNYANQSIDMFNRILPKEHPIVEQANNTLLIATIRLANHTMLSGKREAGLRYYLALGIRPEQLMVALSEFASQFYQAEDLDLSISCYEVLSEVLTPQDRSFKHNLACMYHVKIFKDKNLKHKERYLESLSKARATFERAISIDLEGEVRSSTYVEYSQFLLKYHNKDNKEEYSKITSLLEEAIKRKDGSNLGYNQLEKPAVCSPLQEHLSKQEEITIQPMVLGYYLLIKIHAIHNNTESAYKAYVELRKELQTSRTTLDYSIGYHLLGVAHQEIIAAIVEEVSSISTQSSVLPINACRLIAEYEGSLSYDQALNFNGEGVKYFKSKNYNVAITIFNKAVGLSFTTPISEVLYNRGRTYHESGSIDEAIGDYKELLLVNPNHAKAYYQLGICFKLKGNIMQAETFLKQALEKDPKFEIAQKALDEINKIISDSLASKINQQRLEQQQSYQR